MLQQSTLITTPLKNTDLGHSAWGPRLSHRLTLLRATTLKCTGTSPLVTLGTALPSSRTSETALRASPTPGRHRGHHSTKCASSRIAAPMGPLHLAASTLTLRTFSATTHGPSRPPPTLPQVVTGLHKRRLQEGRGARRRSSKTLDRVFTPRTHVSGHDAP